MNEKDIRAAVRVVADSISSDKEASPAAKKAMIDLAEQFLVDVHRIAEGRKG